MDDRLKTEAAQLLRQVHSEVRVDEASLRVGWRAVVYGWSQEHIRGAGVIHTGFGGARKWPVKRDRKDVVAARPEHPEDLRERGHRPAHVLEYVRRDHQVERVVGEGEIAQVL